MFSLSNLDTRGVASSNESYNVGVAVSSPVFLHLFCKYAIPDLAETGSLSEGALTFLIENLLKIFEYNLWKDLEQYVVPAISKHAKLQEAFAKQQAMATKLEEEIYAKERKQREEEQKAKEKEHLRREALQAKQEAEFLAQKKKILVEKEKELDAILEKARREQQTIEMKLHKDEGILHGKLAAVKPTHREDTSKTGETEKEQETVTEQ
jgi:hypothetical protein